MTENILQNWGASQRQLPKNNGALKTKVLANLKLSPIINSPAPHPLPWLSFGFAAMSLAVVIFLTVNSKGTVTKTALVQNSVPASSPLTNITRTQSATDAVSSSGEGFMNKNLAAPQSQLYRVEPTPPPTSDTIADNREFLKTDYSASISSQNVTELVQQIQNTVKGFDGRIDYLSSTESQGYLYFVIPVDKLDSFKTQVKNLAGAKFCAETLETQNLLNQKQSIESDQQQINNQIISYNNQEETLATEHTKIINSLQAQINSVKKELTQAQSNLVQDPNNSELQAQVKNLQNQIAGLKNNLLKENSNYKAQIDSINFQVQSITQSLQTLNDQNNQLLNKVATVRGSIGIFHISWFDASNIYLTPFWLPTLLILLAFATYYLNKRKNHTTN
jgi:hypothetical protein